MCDNANPMFLVENISNDVQTELLEADDAKALINDLYFKLNQLFIGVNLSDQSAQLEDLKMKF